MHRIQFIELHDQPWFPSKLRDEITEALQCGMHHLSAYAPIYKLLQQALDASGSRSVVDLCSGGGGPWLDLSQKLRGASANSIWLTDKFPSAVALGTLKAGYGNGINFYRSPVDAENVPRELTGFRTMFSSFHHFPPAQARAILRNAVDARQGIGIFEVTSRTVSAAGMMLPWSFTPFILAPGMQPFRWSRLFYTYLIPLIPLVILFDGLISCFRSYQVRELRGLIEDLGPTDYSWETGQQSGPNGSLPVTYLIGYPATAPKVTHRECPPCQIISPSTSLSR